MKPTVIPGSRKETAVRPTVIPTQGQPAQSPTVIQPPAADADTHVPAPTVIKVGSPTRMNVPTTMPSVPEPSQTPAPKPTTISVSNSQPPKTKTVSTATAMPGKARKRIVLTLDELRAQHSAVKETVVQAALGLIQGLNLDDATDRNAVMWGHDAQRAYGSLISTCLALSQSEDLTKVTGHINRVMEILGSINLKKIVGLEESQGMLSRLFGGEGKTPIDTLPELKQAEDELSQIITLVSQRIDRLLALKEDLEKISRNIDDAGDTVEAHMIAAEFLSDYINRHQTSKGGLAGRFSERSASLTQTLAQIRSSGSTMTLQVEQPLHLIASVQHVTLVMLPGWLGNIVSLRSLLAARRQPSVTEINELGDQTQSIIDHLKGR